jgi:hypothetical protein
VGHALDICGFAIVPETGHALADFVGVASAAMLSGDIQKRRD